MPENFPNLLMKINHQIQETQWISNRVNLEKYMPRYIIIKLPTSKDKKKKKKKKNGKK